VRSLTPRWTAHCRLLSEKDGEWLQEVRATANDGAEGHEMSTTRHHPFNINFEIMPAVHSALPHPLHPLHSMSTNNTIMNDITCSPRRHDADTSTHSRGGLHRRLPYGVRAPLLFVRAVGCCVQMDNFAVVFCASMHHSVPLTQKVGTVAPSRSFSSACYISKERTKHVQARGWGARGGSKGKRYMLALSCRIEKTHPITCSLQYNRHNNAKLDWAEGLSHL
jgi:hypothetical protein